MSYPGTVALLICSFGVVVVAITLPYVTAGLRESDRSGISLWSVLAGLALLCAAGLRLRGFNPPPAHVTTALLLNVALLCGIFMKWGLETIAQKKPTIHEGVLVWTLLAAPVSILAGGGIYGGGANARAILLWFLTGWFWHTLFSDVERLLTKEKILIRRREPPTLPYDFRKPEGE